MAVQNLYSNLPGHLVEFKDGGLQLTTSTTDTSSTKSILILGTAFDGPVNEPVKIDEVTVSKVFGDEVDENGYPNGATLTKYAKQAFKNGFDDVRCMRVTGSQAYTIVSNNVVEDASDIQSTEQKIAYVSGGDATVPATQGKIHANEISLYYDYDGEGLFPGNQEDMLIKVGQEVRHAEISGSTGFRPRLYNGITIDRNTIYEDQDVTIEANIWRLLTGASDNVTEAADASTATVVYSDLTATDNVINVPVVSVDDREIYWGNSTAESSSIPRCWYGIAKVTVSFADPEDAEETITGELAYNTDYTVNESDNGRSITILAAEVDGKTIPADATYTVETVQYYKTQFTKTFIMSNLDLYPEITVDSQYTNDDVFLGSFIDVPTRVTHGDNIAIQAVELLPANQNGAKIVIPESYYSTSNATNASGDNVTRVTINNFDFKSLADAPSNLSIVDVTEGIFRVKYSYDFHSYYDLQLKFKSQWGGKLYKDATVEITKETETTTDANGNIVTEGPYTVITLTKPAAKKLRSNVDQVQYSSKYIKTVDDLVLAMKNDANNLNMFDVEIVKGEGTDSLDLLDAIPATAFTEGGEDGVGVSNNEMFIALAGDRYTAEDVGNTRVGNTDVYVTSDMVGYLKTQGAYQILENYNVDFIYPAGVYADSVQTVNPHSDFQRELALVCAVLTYRTKMTHGFIDVKPNSNTTLIGIDSYVSNLVNGRSNIYYMLDDKGEVIYDEDGNPKDIGWYTSVVVGPEPVMQSSKLGTYYGSPAIAYAALNSVLEPASAPTNKAIRNVQGMKFKFSNKQADALVGARYVVFKLKNEGTATASSTPYVVDGCTAGAPNCDYARISTVKVLQDVVDQIREVADPFIGENNTVAQRNALSALISKRLGKLVELGEIQQYEFEISATLQQQLLGEAMIALTIVPAMELRRITTVVALRAAE